MAKRRQNTTLAGMFIPVSLLLGVVVGFIIHNVLAGVFIGLGAGFGLFVIIAFWDTKSKKKKK